MGKCNLSLKMGVRGQGIRQHVSEHPPALTTGRTSAALTTLLYVSSADNGPHVSALTTGHTSAALTTGHTGLTELF